MLNIFLVCQKKCHFVCLSNMLLVDALKLVRQLLSMLHYDCPHTEGTLHISEER